MAEAICVAPVVTTRRVRLAHKSTTRPTKAILVILGVFIAAGLGISSGGGGSTASAKGVERVSGGPTGSYIVPAGIHKIKHIVVIIQENRSFDSYFGTFPGADGIPMQNGVPTVCVNDPQTGKCVAPYPDHADINGGGPHNYANATSDIDGGKMDGFIAQAEAGKQGCANPTDPACTNSATPDTSITNALRLLKLPTEVQLLLAEHRLSMGHARAVLGLPTAEQQIEVAEKAAAQGLSVRQVEALVQDLTSDRPRTGHKKEAVVDPNVKAAVDELERALGTRVRIVELSEQRGRIEIEYYSQVELDRLFQQITGRN